MYICPIHIFPSARALSLCVRILSLNFVIWFGNYGFSPPVCLSVVMRVVVCVCFARAAEPIILRMLSMAAAFMAARGIMFTHVRNLYGGDTNRKQAEASISIRPGRVRLDFHHTKDKVIIDMSLGGVRKANRIKG